MGLHSLGARALLLEQGEPALVDWCRQASLATDHQLEVEGVPVTNGRLALDLGVGLGVPRPLARRAGAVLEILQVATDMADNLADLEKDRVAVAATGPHGPSAAQKLSAVLGRMLVGQGLRGEEHALRVSGDQGRLLCLALWLSSFEEVEAIEEWAFAWGCTWQLTRDVLEARPGADRRLRQAIQRAQRCWPSAPLFEGRFSSERLLKAARRSLQR